MPVTEVLTVKHHQQDTNYYCGAACAQMVLAQAEVGSGILDQDDLYADNHAHSTAEAGWYTAPDGLAWTLNDRRPPAFTNSFVLFALGTEDGISRKICWTIHHYRVAPVALVYGWAHWIVVHGYDASAAPGSSADASYTITGFHVNNPWPPTPAPPPPPPHTAGDVCGTGGIRGVANEHITYATWQADYMTGVPGGYWAGKFVAVCDPEPPADRVGPQRPRDRLAGRRLITPAEAVRQALAGLKQYGLSARREWGEVLEKVKPATPTLVRRLDRLDSYYYIVPLQAARNRVPVLVSVDARFGDYRQAIALAGKGSNLLVPGPQDVQKMIIGQRFELEDRRGRLLVRPEAVCLYPTLVWKPCRESLSPFWPFHMATVGNHHIYVRVDGAIFTQLHDDDRGI